MNQVCFLTERSTILLQGDFPGVELIYFIKPEIWLFGQIISPMDGLQKMPPSGSPDQLPEVHFPEIAFIDSTISELTDMYDEVIVVLPAEKFSFGWDSTRAAVNRSNFRSRIHWIDSQSFSAGVGILCQTGAQAAVAGGSAAEVLEILRQTIPYIYTLLGVCSFSYLHRLGLVDTGQTIVGEMLQMQPVWLVESGRLIPVQKVRSNKNFADLFFDFLQEVGEIEMISLIKGRGCFDKGAGMLAERIEREYPGAFFSQQPLHPSAGAVVGPASITLSFLESIPRRL